MASYEQKIQLDWESDPLRHAWPDGPDMRFIMGHIGEMVVDRTAAGGPRGRLLEVAAAEAVHACKLAKAGFETYVLEPSPAMLERARGWMKFYGVDVTLVQGICEQLPFPDGSFHHVLCDSAIDHFSSPDLGMREMARVLAPGGELIVSFVNYGGLTPRVSRMLYRLERALRPRARSEKRFWDTPVPLEHVFECSIPVLNAMAGQYLEHTETIGLSLGWGFPGWGPLLERMTDFRAGRWLRRLDRIARRWPLHADFVVSVWRKGDAPPRGVRPATAQPHVADFDGERPLIPIADLKITPADPLYQASVETEQSYPHDWVLFSDASLTAAWERFANQAITGDPHRSWLDDVMARGPFESAAFLGVDGTMPVSRWMQAGTSTHVDVLDVTQSQLDRVATAVASTGSDQRGLRLIRTDLNFVRLPAARYDVIVSSGTLHHVQNLEYLLDEIRRALRPGGLFVLNDYVGERRHAYREERLVRVNRLLAEIPDVYKLDPTRVVERGHPYYMSPFCALRSEDIPALVRQRFEIVEEKLIGYIAPLPIMLDLRRVEADAPELLTRLHEEEAKAAADPAMRPFGAFMVGRVPAR